MARWWAALVLVFVGFLCVTLGHTTMLTTHCCTPEGSGGSNDLSSNIWNSSAKSSNITLSGANLVATANCASAWCNVRGMRGYTTGKHYIAMTMTGTITGFIIGLGNDSTLTNTFCGADAVPNSAGYQQQRSWWLSGGATANALAASMVSGDQLILAVDIDAKKAWGKVNQINTNGSWSQGGSPTAGTFSNSFTGVTGVVYPCFSAFAAEIMTLNAGTTDSDTGLVGFTVW